MLGRAKTTSSLAITVSVVASLSTPVLAADLLMSEPAVPAPVLVPASETEPGDKDHSWNGFYVGGHLGGALIDWTADTSFVATGPLGERNSATFPGLDSSNGSFLAGVQAGYNWQSGDFLFGLEATASVLTGDSKERYHISSARMISSGLGAITDPVDGFESDWNRNVNWLVTAKARVGYLVNPNAFLYLTGGPAAGEVQSDISYIGLVDHGAPTLVSKSSDSKQTQLGYTVGAGAEAALTDKLSIRLEYLFVDLGSSDRPRGKYLDTACCVQTVSTKEDVKIHTFMIGLNYRFGGP